MLVISGVISFAVVEMARQARMSWAKKNNVKDKPWWWKSLLRLCAIILGGGVGHFLMPWPLGPLLGLVGGALNTTIVAVVKKKIKNVDGSSVVAANTGRKDVGA